MKITDEQFTKRKEYVKGMFSLGGLSECGKSAAGFYFDSIGIKRMKIIAIEKEMMLERNYQFSGHPTENDFKKLYANNPEQIFREFLYRLIGKMQEAGTHYASLKVCIAQNLGHT